MDNLLNFKIAGIGGGSLVIGTGAGLAAWWAQDAVDTQIRDKPWLIPILVGISAMGVSIWMFAR